MNYIFNNYVNTCDKYTQTEEDNINRINNSTQSVDTSTQSIDTSTQTVDNSTFNNKYIIIGTIILITFSIFKK